MKGSRVVVARIWSRYRGDVSSRAGIIAGLDTERFRTICIYLMKNSSEPNYFEQKGYSVYYKSKKRFLRVLNPGIICKLVKVLKDEKVDIIHCHRHQSSTYGTIAGLIARTPSVVTHVHGLNRSKNARRKLVNRLTLRLADKILTVSEGVRQDVLKANPAVKAEKVISIGNSIDYERYANVSTTKQQAKENIGLKADSFVFGSVGRLAPTKGYSYLISAFESVKKEIPAACLVFIGDGRLRNELEKQASETAAVDSIHFLGYRDNVPELLKAMDVFVLSSIAEGLPRSLLEAMAAGVPCVGTEVGGIPEILADGEFGYLVPPKDDKALAEAMLGLAEKTYLQREALIQKARQRVMDKYSHAVVRERLENIYDNELTNLSLKS